MRNYLEKKSHNSPDHAGGKQRRGDTLKGSTESHGGRRGAHGEQRLVGA